jgi:CheY-like chemotaxis protein
MSGAMREQTDLKALRVLVVGGRLSGVQILRAVLGLAGIGGVVAEQQARPALELLRQERFAALFCDDYCQSVAGMAFPLAARRTPGVLNPTIPIFMLCSAARRRQIEQARDTGVTDVLTPPLRTATVVRKLCTALASPRPFIAAADFFGPDRRARRGDAFSGDERRARAAHRLKPGRDNGSDGVPG